MSFTLKINGAKATVSRSLTLPKVGNVDAVTLANSFDVTLDLGGIKPNTPIFKEILKKFEGVYKANLKQPVLKLENEALKDWTAVAKAVAGAKDQAVAEKLAAAVQKKILSAWNAFPAKVGIPFADASIAYVLKEMKSDAAARGAKPKLKLGDAALKDDRVGILKAILGGVVIVAAGVPTGGLGWLAAGLGGLASLMKGAESSMSLSAKRSGEVEKNGDQIRDGLKKAGEALAGLAPSIERMVKSREEFTLEMAGAARELAKAQKALAELEKRAGKDAGPAQKKKLEGLRNEVNLLFFKANAFEKATGEIDKLATAVDSATKAVAAANSLIAKDAVAWKDQKGALQSLWKDKDTVLSSLKSVVSEVSKL
ncbi:hypothetical protein [Frigidibacter sp. ROC022]|uniref:hypothetical protein n=1 Tax=Frigidibacter sp. ROC022 TaxID=2971796 RepID=UPI00215A233C|nr:hypothetical protein [Frigidibacter sp. ROC022]MCR8723742.1 hypothetical protein [Frigidibacter sp. ROC022]